jgi:predicted CoA-substrate-specific enzyme activase
LIEMSTVSTRNSENDLRAAGSLHVGLDLGSVALKAVLLNDRKEVLESSYLRLEGQPAKVTYDFLRRLPDRLGSTPIASLSFTGSGAKAFAQILEAGYFNEVIAQAEGTFHLHPEVRSIIELGGEDSKLILLGENGDGSGPKIRDFATNSLCAAGTGSFLDQQASRLGIKIEGEFGELALKSKKPPHIAGRCSVFAKSDMIHLQQIATPVYDIIAGLCFAVARNFKSNLASGRKLIPPVSFQGGPAANLGLVRAFREVFGLSDGEFLVPRLHPFLGAIGAVLLRLKESTDRLSPYDRESLKGILELNGNGHRPHPRLVFSFPDSKFYDLTRKVSPINGKKVEAFLGVDVGSLSTNLAVIDRDRNILARTYLMTAGRPLEAVKRGLRETAAQVRDSVVIRGVGSTGSGRYLAGDFVGADVIRNEITSQARAALSIDPTVDTIFEIGGQDSKYVCLENGAVVDFEMNKACAAGTGSFLQEQAEKLGIEIEEEFGRLSLSAQNPVGCGERCTVFMESDLVSHQHCGAPKEDLVAGLAYSIVLNYLNKVVGHRKIGDRIFFQGGVAWNKGVVAAFEKVLGKKITVPPHHDLTGAVGAAILAMEEMGDRPTKFKGFDLSERSYRLSTFECDHCPNLCLIRRVEIEGEEPLFYGGRCERYEVRDEEKPHKNVTNLFPARNLNLTRNLREREQSGVNPERRKGRVGIPRLLFFWELLPFFSEFFRSLGWEVILSNPTTDRIVREGVESATSEVCFPCKVALGQARALLDKDIDLLFVPSLINVKGFENGDRGGYVCPFVQAFPFLLKAGLSPEMRERVHSPMLHFRHGFDFVLRELLNLRGELRSSRREIKAALRSAWSAQVRFERENRELGERFLGSLANSDRALVILGRPYNICDARLTLDLPKRLSKLGRSVIPMDLLPLPEGEGEAEGINMYWSYGRKLLEAARFIRRDKRLFAVHVTNFGCGPDSFISHHLKRIMRGKPFLQLEIDEHTADAGIITRCEAFLDSLRNHKAEGQSRDAEKPVAPMVNGGLSERTLLLPHMCDHAQAFKGVLESYGARAEVLPESDEESLRLGRKFTSGRECYPAVLTTGDLVRFLQREKPDPGKVAFFMPAAAGPCRFGQYHQLHRLIVEELGLPEVMILSPSSRDGYDYMSSLGRDIRQRGLEALVAVDNLRQTLLRVRPYENTPGECDQVYHRYLEKLYLACRSRGNLREVLGEAACEFGRIPADGERKPLVCVIGEIYIRNNRFANDHLVDKIESLGGEVYLSPVCEWISYTSYMYRRESLKLRRFRDFLAGTLQQLLQSRIQRRLSEPLQAFLGDYGDAPTEVLLKLAHPYLPDSVGGEAILTIGKGIEMLKEEACGIINAMPFTCMPGNIVAGLSKRVQENYPEVPWLNIAYEGQEETKEMMRLEAFMYRARQAWESREQDGEA